MGVATLALPFALSLSKSPYATERHSGPEPESRKASPNPAYGEPGLLDTCFRRYDDISGEVVQGPHP